MSKSANESPVVNLAFALVYSRDLNTAVNFYQKYFGFVEDKSVKMGDDQMYGTMGEVGLWIGGGHEKSTMSEKSTRATAMLGVRSTYELFDKLKNGNVRLYQKAPVEMKPGSYWFQFADPDDNIWDVLGAE